MRFFTTRMKAWCALLCLFAVFSAGVRAQQNTEVVAKNDFSEEITETNVPKPLVVSILPNYYNSQNGISLNELIKSALDANQDLLAARLEIDKAKARLAQAKLRPNPTLEFEQSSGRLVGTTALVSV